MGLLPILIPSLFLPIAYFITGLAPTGKVFATWEHNYLGYF